MRLLAAEIERTMLAETLSMAVEGNIRISLWLGTEYFTHHANQSQGAAITNTVIDAVGILAGCKYALVA